MFFDIFFSICQTPVNGIQPTEWQMFQNFFDQVEAADELGYGVAWVAESHLSCEIQKRNDNPVIPNFSGEIGLNTDILLLAPHIFARTKKIEVGAAIKSLFCNGGPIAHAEAVRSFMTLHQFSPNSDRRLHLGIAAGRFPFSSAPYGIVPRSDVEKAAWPALKGKIFAEALEVFIKFVRGDVFESSDVTPTVLRREDFRTDEDWARVKSAAEQPQAEQIVVPNRWHFENLGIIPKEASLNALKLYVGTHDPKLQELANEYWPCGILNLSITPGEEIERAQERMTSVYHPAGGAWQRSFMPRTVLVFLDSTPGLSADQQSARAHEKARKALNTYWKALEGTLDPVRIEKAVDNALVGNALEVAEQLNQRFHSDDRLMLWFDFFNHNSQEVIANMRDFQRFVAPLVNGKN